MCYHRLQLVVHQPQLAAMLLHGDQGQGSQRTLQVGMLPAALQQQCKHLETHDVMQIGQIMLSMPNAFAKMGLAAGLVLSIASGLISAYTIVLLVHLYEERKRRLVYTHLQCN